MLHNSLGLAHLLRVEGNYTLLKYAQSFPWLTCNSDKGNLRYQTCLQASSPTTEKQGTLVGVVKNDCFLTPSN